MSNLSVDQKFFQEVVNNLRSDLNFLQETQLIINEKRKDFKNSNQKYIGHYFDGAGFFNEDSDLMKFFHNAVPEKKKEICQSFKNDGIRKNAELLIFNKYPEILSKTERDNKIEELHNEFFDENNSSRVTYSFCCKDFIK